MAFEYPAHTGYNFTSTLHNDIYPPIDPTASNLSQPGKVILITGAGRGIGRSIAIRYAESGVSSIILAARTPSELTETEACIKKINPAVRVHKYAVDVTSEPSIHTMSSDIKASEGRLDVLINNAGMTNKWESITSGPTKPYLQTWDLHIKGTYLMLKHFLPLLVETAEKHGVKTDVINTTSVAAHFAVPGASAYQASKFALVRLGECVDAEYAGLGVNCVTLHPGGVATTIAKDLGDLVKAGESPPRPPPPPPRSLACYVDGMMLMSYRADRHRGAFRWVYGLAYKGSEGVVERTVP